jgi:2-isopropylmalate synthase
MKNFDKYTRQYFMPPVMSYDWVKKDHIEKVPAWCSVDLRDGNQALIEPMGLEEKLQFFKMLVDIGFKEIEVGFPAASETEFLFLRSLIEREMIPDDVTIQVLTQAREHIIKKTFEALKGAPHAVVHLYNSTSVAQREQVFKKDKAKILQLAVDGAKLLKELAEQTEGNFSFEYSPESFHGTEVEYALEVCNAVLDVWQPTEDHKAIINIPATVETAMPHVFASQIEYLSKNMKYRNAVMLSLHPHNDRGCGVADAELGLLAGADRIEGTLFGNGERTGNVDIITIAMNMYSYGIDPQLDFSNMPKIRDVYEKLTGMKVYDRQPYAGDLVFTAFSGSHQDAIRKGMAARKKMPADSVWDVPYLPIDPHDVGREYEGIIRINSQSGKGGAAYILESNFGIIAPKGMHPVIGAVVKAKADRLQRELTPQEVYDLFAEKWLRTKSPLNVLNVSEHHNEGERGTDTPDQVLGMATIAYNGEEYSIAATGNGPLDAFVSALRQTPVPAFNVTYFNEHSIGEGSNTKAMAYVQLTMEDGTELWGAGTSSNIGRAGIAAVVSALNFKE